jgi:hypothetical protein
MIDKKWSQCMGRLVLYHPVTVCSAIHEISHLRRTQRIITMLTRENSGSHGSECEADCPLGCYAV